MKSTSVLTVVSSLLIATYCAASDTHDADKGLEGTLRATLNERHVHVHVHHGIVDLDGEVLTTADRDRIESLVRNTSGVVAVKDKLRVTLPTPGVHGGNPSSIPVYAAPPPPVTPPAAVVTAPAPVIIPDYPKLKVQPATAEDESVANRIARQLKADSVTAVGAENITITVRDGIVSLQGRVEALEQRDSIIAALQRVPGVKTIYDQLVVR
jgi:hypothetical protein